MIINSSPIAFKSAGRFLNRFDLKMVSGHEGNKQKPREERIDPAVKREDGLRIDRRLESSPAFVSRVPCSAIQKIMTAKQSI